MLGEDRGDEFTMDKVEVMDVDYEQAMKKRADYQAEIEAKLEAQKSSANETFIPLTASDQAEKRDTPGIDGCCHQWRWCNQSALRPCKRVSDLRGINDRCSFYRSSQSRSLLFRW